MTSKSTVRRLAIQSPDVLAKRINHLERLLELAVIELSRPKKPTKELIDTINYVLEVKL